MNTNASSPPLHSFDGLVAVVTGGGSGIGLETSRVLAEQGARVIQLDLTPGPAASFVRLVCDVGSTASVEEAIEQVHRLSPVLDVLVNCAGVGAQGDVSVNSDEEWATLLNVNLIGVARVSRTALPLLRASSTPAIVNVCSVLASIGVPNRALYSASKGGVAALTRAMAADHIQEGIRVNAVSPGTTDTPWVHRMVAASEHPEATAEVLRGRQPQGRLVAAREVAHAIAYLASPESLSTTGAILNVDGGMVGMRVPS